MTMKPDVTDVQPSADYRIGYGEVDFGALARALWRRKVLIICTTAALTVTVAAVTLSLTPMYSATGYVMIDPGQTQTINPSESVIGLSNDPAAMLIESEARILDSRGLAGRVVNKLQLDQNPEFNRSLEPPGLLDQFLTPMKNLLASGMTAAKQWVLETIGDTRAEETSNENPVESLRIALVDRLLSILDVAVVPGSRVIGITFRSENPETAARVVNTLADLYIVMRLEARAEAIQVANQWLNDRLVELRQQVESAEAAVEHYRAQKGLIESRDITLTTQEASELGAQLALVRSQRAEAESELRAVRSANSGVGGLEAVPDVLSSALIQQLRAQEVEALRKISSLSQSVGQNHPDLVSARAGLAEVRARIQIEIDKIIQGLKTKAAVASAREASLTANLEDLKAKAGEQNESEVKLRALEREAAASRTLLETFLDRAQQTGSQATYRQPDVRIVSKADVPQAPTFPNKTIVLPAGFLASSAIGVLLALLLEMMNHSFRSEEQAEQILGVASFGLIPMFNHTYRKSKTPLAYVAEHPASAYAESIRNLSTGLRLSNGNHLPRIILIASSLPIEGKTTVVLSFASLLSAAGFKTIVVDADLRRPSIHRVLAIASQPGLVDYLCKQVPLMAVIQRHQGVDVLTAGSPAANPSELLSTDRMKDLLTELKTAYDVVILDSAPLLAVSDGRILVRIVDKTVFLVRWADTRRDAALRALQQISEEGNNVAGTMLTMVDVRKYAKSRYGAFSYYYRRIEHYYGA